jgi:hypothetical protein
VTEEDKNLERLAEWVRNLCDQYRPENLSKNFPEATAAEIRGLREVEADAVLAMARAIKIMAEPNDYPPDSEWARDDRETEMQVGAIRRARLQREAMEKAAKEKEAKDREAKAAPIPADAMEWKSHSGLPPGVMALVLSRTLRHVAGNDGHMAQWAADIERRARAVIRLCLSRLNPNDTAH